MSKHDCFICKEARSISTCPVDLSCLLEGLVGDVKGATKGLICSNCLTLLQHYQNILDKLNSIETTIKGHFGLNEIVPEVPNQQDQFYGENWHGGDQFYAISSRKGNSFFKLYFSG